MYIVCWNAIINHTGGGGGGGGGGGCLKNIVEKYACDEGCIRFGGPLSWTVVVGNNISSFAHE